MDELLIVVKALNNITAELKTLNANLEKLIEVKNKEANNK